MPHWAGKWPGLLHCVHHRVLTSFSLMGVLALGIFSFFLDFLDFLLVSESNDSSVLLNTSEEAEDELDSLESE